MTSERRLAIVVTLIGIAIRVSQVVFDRSLWTDEAMLALSIGTRGFAELTRPLLFEQIAPALRRMEHAGAVLTGVMSVMYELVGDSSHPAFRVCLDLVKAIRQ